MITIKSLSHLSSTLRLSGLAGILCDGRAFR
jgi:hypothetical protein